MTRSGRDLVVVASLFAAVALARGLVATRWPLLADEAYHWVWSLHPAWGYYDQPPLIAWMIAATTRVGTGELWVRAGALLGGVAAPLLLLRHAGDRPLVLLWWIGVPALCWLCLFATPDAPLLAAWALALAAACRGGRWWVVAGLAAGMAVLCKYTGAAVLPLLILGAGPREWRSPWPWLGLVLAGLIALPNLVWNANHGWVSLSFQLQEGLVHPDAPGLAGPVRQVFDQALVLSPLVFAAGLWWSLAAVRPVLRSWRRGGDDRARVVRLCWFTSVPVFILFALAAAGGPPEAHWPAPAAIGLGLGLSHGTGPQLRLAWVGAWVGLLLSALLAIHVAHPLLPLRDDPAVRLAEGPPLAAWLATWAYPPGTDLDRPDRPPATAVYTERYQEAALVHYYAGIPASVFPGCGRASQYDLWQSPAASQALFLRPTTGGDGLCTDARYPHREGPWQLDPRDDHGRQLGSWQLFRVAR